MKKIIYLFFLLWIFGSSKSQSNPFSVACAFDDAQIKEAEEKLNSLLLNCGNTSPFYSNNNLYLPQSSDEVIYIKLNFIFLTKPDGTGNFEQNNPEHLQVIDDIIAAMNYRLANLGQPVSGCDGYGGNNLTNTKIQVVVNKIWKSDPAWDYLYTGYIPCTTQGAPISCTNFNKVYPPSTDYYFTYLDNDPTIPSGINIVFSDNGNIYNHYMTTGDYTVSPGEGWAASEFPYYAPMLDRKLRQFWPNLFNKYLWMKNYIADNPDPNSPYPNTPWSTVRSWYVGVGYGSFPHELGHNLGLGHHDCGSNIMSYDSGNHDYFSNNDIATMFRMASITSARQYFTDDSFKNTNINITNNQIFDLNFRLYSNVKIDNNSSLKAACKIIMAPESRFIVKDGSNFIMEGAEINSTNASSWNGIKVEGNGYFLINPDTQIEGNYFYAYADNTLLPKGKANISQSRTSIQPERGEIKTVSYKIYPNPTGDFVNIDTKENITKIEVYNLSGKNFKVNFTNKKVDVRSLPAGNYILRIYSSNDVRAVHFIKQIN